MNQFLLDLQKVEIPRIFLKSPQGKKWINFNTPYWHRMVKESVMVDCLPGSFEFEGEVLYITQWDHPTNTHTKITPELVMRLLLEKS